MTHVKHYPHIEWGAFTWELQERWGKVHPDYPYMWSDPEQVSVVNGILELRTQYKPKVFGPLEDMHIPSFAKGFACCMQKFYHGRYIIEAQLPEGKNLWPAIWLYAHESWPPEIDIMEAYSNKKGSYCKFGWPIYNIASDFHYKDSKGNHKRLGSKKIYVGIKNPTKRWIKYEMIWTRTFIKLYVNDRLHRVISGGIMERFNTPMRMILSAQVTGKKIPDDKTEVFRIKSFSYQPYND